MNRRALLLYLILIIGIASLSDKKEYPTQITNLKACSSKSDVDCEVIEREHNDIFLYWEVIGGTGCCHGYGCDYGSFYSACLYPNFRLYEVYVDGEKESVSLMNWDYTCDEKMISNWAFIEDLSVGNHFITVYQGNCNGSRIARKTIELNLKYENNRYYLEQEVK